MSKILMLNGKKYVQDVINLHAIIPKNPRFYDFKEYYSYKYAHYNSNNYSYDTYVKIIIKGKLETEWEDNKLQLCYVFEIDPDQDFNKIEIIYTDNNNDTSFPDKSNLTENLYTIASEYVQFS